MRLVVHSHIRIYREALAALLARQSEFEVVAVSGAMSECLFAVRRTDAEMLLLDSAAPDALELARRQNGPEGSPWVLALGLPEDEDAVVAYAEAGMAGYVAREDSAEDLLEAMRGVVRGEARCSSRTTALLLRRVATLAADRHELGRRPGVRLTRRELEIGELVDAGLSNKQIAIRLGIELPTVKNHVHNILEKLDVARRGEAAAALRAGGLLGGNGASALG
jgi:DNA-binding NarL/FixJ family response regulator